jgi:transposase
MATERLSMRKTREILRHKWLLGRGYREVARSVDVSLGAVWLAVQRATEAGLDWPAVEGSRRSSRARWAWESSVISSIVADSPSLSGWSLALRPSSP